MPRLDVALCRGCGRSRDEVGLLSWTRLCQECGRKRLRENIDGIHTKSGLAHARWRLGIVAAALRDPSHVNELIDAGEFAYLDERPNEP